MAEKAETEKFFSVNISESTLMASSEAIAALYVGFVRETPCSVLAVGLVMNYAEGLVQALRELLQAPLRNREFKRKFFEYYEHHPIMLMRAVALPWLEESLTFES
jgi:hypothetical protein